MLLAVLRGTAAASHVMQSVTPAAVSPAATFAFFELPGAMEAAVEWSPGVTAEALFLFWLDLLASAAGFLMGFGTPHLEDNTACQKVC